MYTYLYASKWELRSDETFREHFLQETLLEDIGTRIVTQFPIDVMHVNPASVKEYVPSKFQRKPRSIINGLSR